jgi:hypothetical protein
MSEELFPDMDMASESPRSRWLSKHRLTTVQLRDERWLCILDEETMCAGSTEEEASVRLANQLGIKYWRVADFERATETTVSGEEGWDE